MSVISQLTEFVHLFLQCELTFKNATEITGCAGKGDVTLTHTYGRRKINARSRAYQKNFCFVVIELKFILNYSDLHVRNAGFIGP